jgi:PTS system fructose-specific IIC component
VVMALMRIRVQGPLSKMMPVMVYPLVGTLVTAALLVLVIGNPIADAQEGLTDWLTDLQGTNAVLLGLLIGAMMAFDMGGPVNKAAYAFGLASLDSGNLAVMAAVMIAGMTPPLGLALATVLRPKRFTDAERESGKAAWPLGLSFITEGAIPFAAADPVRVIPALMAGSAVAGAVSMAVDAELRAPHGGIFVVGLIDGKLGYLVAGVLGTVVTAALVIALKSLRRGEDAAVAEADVATAPAAPEAVTVGA